MLTDLSHVSNNAGSGRDGVAETVGCIISSRNVEIAFFFPRLCAPIPSLLATMWMNGIVLGGWFASSVFSPN